MNAAQAIQQTAATSDMVVAAYLADLEDSDLLRRPHPGCNHLAWQLGHLIAAECNLLNLLSPGAAPSLPAGFVENHSKEATSSDDPSHFGTKQEYLDLYKQVRAASHAAIAAVRDSDLDAPNPKEDFRAMFPTVGSMYVLNATHPMMHVGQWAPLRRELGKPIAI
ncbi:DinB family protein [Botrimarina hoheduenensis]|uniref:DinB superfamily protein n=1 Tax=Botrimarina hoheduenensis TaxID=2528000 RepID=A0A5C5WDX6_9BACT|nr:DinB family protein [Botrimarina hoheduenensis]TWT48667.1 DinB superfamily protein [Botrimarina hoheduenensis]